MRIFFVGLSFILYITIVKRNRYNKQNKKGIKMDDKSKVLFDLYYELIEKYNEVIEKLNKFLADGKEHQLLIDEDDDDIHYSYLDDDNISQTVLISKIRYSKKSGLIEGFDTLNEKWLSLIDMEISTIYDIISTIQWNK